MYPLLDPASHTNCGSTARHPSTTLPVELGRHIRLRQGTGALTRGPAQPHSPYQPWTSHAHGYPVLWPSCGLVGRQPLANLRRLAQRHHSLLATTSLSSRLLHTLSRTTSPPRPASLAQPSSPPLPARQTTLPTSAVQPLHIDNAHRPLISSDTHPTPFQTTTPLGSPIAARLPPRTRAPPTTAGPLI